MPLDSIRPHLRDVKKRTLIPRLSTSEPIGIGLNSKLKRAFTLVELVVVCACLAILAALLLSALPRAISEVRSAKCKSNLRQIGIAAQLWSMDNNGKVVPVFYPTDGGSQLSQVFPAPWTGMLVPYMGYPRTLSATASIPVFICPESPTRFGYGNNYIYLTIMTGSSVSQWVYYAQVAHPSETVFIVDECYPSKGLNAWKPYVRPPAFGSQDIIVDFKHPGKIANVLWLDGHVTPEIKDSDVMKDDQFWDRN